MIGQNRTVPEPIYRAALVVVESMTWRSEGMGRLDRMKTLLRLAATLGCIIEVKVGCESSYAPDLYAGGAAGAIAIDATMPRFSQIRNLAHEIGHHMLFWQKRFLYMSPALLRDLEKCGDPENVEEAVCQVIEDLVMELPFGLMWNGKLAPPRGDGTIRCFQQVRRRVPSQQMAISEIDRLLAEED